MQAAYAESHATPHRVAGPLLRELVLLKDWLGLKEITVARKGNLARRLQAALGR